MLDRHPQDREAYVDALVREIHAYGRHLHRDKQAIRGVHFGGGTPTLLGHAQFARILAALRASFDLGAQLLTGAKHELRLRVGPGQTVAVASFNLHGQFIARRFDLRPAGAGADEHIFTGCFAVGLERLLFAFLSQRGLEVAGWPALVREQLEDERARATRLEDYARAALAGAGTP